MPKLTRALESATRKKIDSTLDALDWKTDEESPECNVYTERVKTEEQKKKLKRKQPDYVLYKSGTDEPIAVIEAKRKGESLEKALNQAIKYAKLLGVNIIFVYDSTFIKTYDLRSDSELKIDKEPVKELISEERLLRFIELGSDIEEVTPEVKHTREELIRIFEWSHALLRKEGLRNLDKFVEFSNILFIKIISEIEDDRERRGLGRKLDKSLSWENIVKIKEPKAMLNYINDTVLKEGLAKQYNRSDDIFQQKLKITNPNTVKQIVDRLSKLRLLNTESEIKGDAFEYFLKSLASGNDLGEYFTPRHIVALMVRLVEPRYGNTILDPFCGTGGFLIEAFRKMKKGQDENDETIMYSLKEESIFGIELTDTYKIAKMNMIITGDGHNNIVQTDTAKRDYWEKFIENSKEKEPKIKKLKEIQKKGFDVILSNIPYSQTTDYGSKYPVPSNNGDSVFIQEIILALATKGRCAVIVPEGFLFRRELMKTREYLLDNCSLDAIISLPSGVFLPYTGVKTNILVFTKGETTKSVWYFKIENDGFELNVGRKRIDGRNDIDSLLETWGERKITKNSLSISIDKIKSKNFNLSLSTYETIKHKEAKREDVAKIINKIILTEDEVMKELIELRNMLK